MKDNNLVVGQYYKDRPISNTISVITEITDDYVLVKDYVQYTSENCYRFTHRYSWAMPVFLKEFKRIPLIKVRLLYELSEIPYNPRGYHVG